MENKITGSKSGLVPVLVVLNEHWNLLGGKGARERTCLHRIIVELLKHLAAVIVTDTD